jgi:hypothetical protein
LSFEEKKNIIKFLRERLGRPYSISTVIGIFLSKVGIISRKFYDNEQAYICSELVARVLKEMNKLSNTIEVDKDIERENANNVDEELKRMQNMAKFKKLQSYQE